MVQTREQLTAHTDVGGLAIEGHRSREAADTLLADRGEEAVGKGGDEGIGYEKKLENGEDGEEAQPFF